MSFKDLALTSLDTIRGYSLDSAGIHLFTLDELSTASINQTQEKQDIVGKLGRKLSSFKKNKAVNVSASNGLVSGGLFALQTGSKFAHENDVLVRVAEELKVTGIENDEDHTEAVTTNKASGTAGAEIIEVDVIGNDNTVVKVLKQDATAGSGKFTYDTSTKKLQFGKTSDALDVAAGTTIIVHYDFETEADILKNRSDTYSGKCRLYVDATAEDICGNQYHVQFHIPKADVNGEFSLEMGDNQTVHAFEAEALSGSCGTGAVFFEYIVFGTQSGD